MRAYFFQTGRFSMDIGSKLKELRVLKGLTQEELADRAELSKGFISQLERALTSPSIATLIDILQCLGTTIGDFFTETPDEQIVFGKQDYFEKIDTDLNNEIKWIIPNAQKNMMEPILLTLKAGGSTYSVMCSREAFPSTSAPRHTRPKKVNPFISPQIKSIILQARTARCCCG